ncbi:MAG: apolipoprotein N-acyltransferase [Candidatus Aminicenantales bacterium]
MSKTEKRKKHVSIRGQHLFLALLSGILTALAFPKFGLSFLAWVSLLPVLFVLGAQPPKASFFTGLVAGIGFNALLIYWIPAVPAHYADMSIGLSVIIYLLFVGYLAMFWGIFAWTFSRIRSVFPRLVYFLVPFVWVALEYILTHLFTGFPWGLIGNSQYLNLWLLQLAPLAGVYGVSFVILFFQSMFVFSFRQKKRMPFLAAVIAVTAIHAAGWYIVKNAPHEHETFTAGVIQGNVPSDIYWNQVTEDFKRDLFRQHITLARRGFNDGARLIIWPEFSVPLCFSCPYGIYEEFKQELFRFVRETGSTLLIGTNETTPSGKGPLSYNTALCLHPDLTMSRYYKMHLVPFGEYIPYKTVFSFIQKMTHAIGDITPGETHVLHEYGGHPFGSPICYEIIFPAFVRAFVRKGARFLVTITNDGWYGKSSAPYQHFAMAVFRAVETRRYILRAATTGVSGIIDPYGRILARSQMMTQTCLTARIAPREDLTPYVRYGDVLPVASLTLSAPFLIFGMFVRRNV